MKGEARISNPVRVSLPASVAADIGSLKKTLGGILDKLGCQACCSGHDIFFELQRDFFLKRKLTDTADIAAFSRNPKLANFEHLATPTVRVGIQPEIANNIDDVFLAIDRIAELSGHPACATGCDMFLQIERNFVIDAKLKIEEQVLRFG